MPALGPVEILILLAIVYFAVPRLRRVFAFRFVRESEIVESSLRLKWLIIPLICLIVLGKSAVDALVVFPRAEFNHQVSEVAIRQGRMAKVVRELSEPGSEAQNVPDWLKNVQTSNDQILLTSDQFTTRLEAENQLLPMAAVYLQRAFHQQHPWQGPWTVPVTQIRERVVLQQFVDRRAKTIGKFNGDMYRLHMLINVSPSISETFTEGWKAQIVQRRLGVFGVVIGWGAVMSLLSAVYFNRATHPENNMGWAVTLLMSVVTIGLTVGCVWLINDGNRWLSTVRITPPSAIDNPFAAH